WMTGLIFALALCICIVLVPLVQDTSYTLTAILFTIMGFALYGQQYRAAKLRVYEKAKVCVVNADDALTMPVRGADERCVSFGVN
ncbi:hypothetical protein MJL81_31945, partial [Salmonella enterica subsp. enterica serovar Anatum]|nr:hypothetical protein [Salmonella enterica subsp. enterica serovar Anatum]